MSLEERSKGVIAATATKDQCELSIYLINLKGSAHSRLYEHIPSQSRRTVTFSILKLIGHQISSSPWSLNSQLTVWTTALVAF
jgi:hypothetical protein